MNHKLKSGSESNRRIKVLQTLNQKLQTLSIQGDVLLDRVSGAPFVHPEE